MVYEEEKEGDVSEWNPAMWKMRRLGDLGNRLHVYRLNPQGFSSEYQEYNYNLWVRDLKNWYLELYSRLGTDEVKAIEEIKKAIEVAFTHYPVQIQIKVGNTKRIYWDDKIWQIYLHYIEIFEKLLCEAAEKHGLDSPTKSESSMF